MARFRKLTEKVERGQRPMYRTANWMQYERDIEKNLNKKKWYGANIETVVFVQATPNEILKKAVQLEADSIGLRIKVIEKGERDVKSILQRSDIQTEKKMQDML